MNNLSIIFNFLLGVIMVFSSKDSYDGRIFNGKIATRGMFPHQVFIMLPKGDHKYILCGGSLVSDSYVITAAHCTNDHKKATVYLGIIDSVSRNGGEKREASEIHVHPDFGKPYHLLNDISIIKLSSPVKTTKYIKPISLPHQSESAITTFDDKYATASGWGKTNNDQGKARYLQYNRLHVGSHEFCKRDLKHHHFENKQLCTDKTVYSAPCKGDSGGPLVYYRNNTEPVLIGVVSWGIGPCVNSRPNVYTYVGSFLNYISQITKINIIK